MKTRVRGPQLVINLINVFKGFVPDLNFEITGHVAEPRRLLTSWSATGSHDGGMPGIAPTGRTVRLDGVLETKNVQGQPRLGGSWDTASFCQQVGISSRQLGQWLDPRRDEVILRTRLRERGVPVLLFPTLSLPGWITWKQFTDVLERRRPVVTFQCLGNRWALDHRQAPARYTIKLETRALAKALTRSSVSGPFHIVGHSIGGTLALDFALDHPDQVRSLTLIEPGPVWVLDSNRSVDGDIKGAIRSRMTSYGRSITNTGYAAFFRRTVLEKGYEPTKSPYWAMLCCYKNNMSFRAAFYKHRDDLRRLRTAPFPVMLIQGTHSDRLHHEIGQSLQANFPDVRVIEMPGGHVPHYRDGAASFLEHLARFHRASGRRARVPQDLIGLAELPPMTWARQ